MSKKIPRSIERGTFYLQKIFLQNDMRHDEADDATAYDAD